MKISLFLISLFLFISLFFISCQHLVIQPKSNQDIAEKREVKPAHIISKKEESSKEVIQHLNETYTSHYGEIQMDDNESVDRWISYFQTSGRDRMSLYLSRSSRYIPMMKNVLREYKLPENLVYVAMIESGFSPRAHSIANAVGYWQFIEETGRRYGLKVNPYVDERKDPVLATRAAAEYFIDLYNIFASWHLALASYNAGEYRVNRSVMRYYNRDFWYLSAKKSLPRETANYVPKFIAAVRISKNSEKYGFQNIDYQPALEYDTVPLEFSINLQKLAKKMGVDYQSLRDLNPRYTTEYVPYDRGEETMLRIPIGKKDQTIPLLAQCRMKQPRHMYVTHRWYRVRRGDTLYRLARRNKTTVSTIRRMNKMHYSTVLRAGKKIKLPYKRGYHKKYVAKKPSLHKVKRGESLSIIARKYALSTSKLKKINKLNRRSVIHPGQILKLVEKPSRQVSGKPEKRAKKLHVVQWGETLIGIAKKYNVSLPALMKHNGLNFNSVLAAGRQIIIPK